MLGRGVDLRLGNRSRSPWRRLRPALQGVELFGFNLECAITDAPPWGSWKKFRFRLRPAAADRALESFPVPAKASVFASIANNHVLDFGPVGLADTLATLDRAEIAHAGSGADATEAWRPAVITTASGARVGVLAVADHCGCLRMSQWVAGRSQPGLAYLDLSSERWHPLLVAVASLEPAVDLLVVSLHSGPNYLSGDPPGWLRRLARALIEAGADVVWSHSPHQVLPLEQIRGRHVIYGTGGLIDDYNRRPEYRNDLGLILRLTVAPGGRQSAEVVPLRIRTTGPELLDPDDPDHAEVLRRAGVDQIESSEL